MAYVNKSKVSAHLGVSPQTVMRLVVSGKLPCYRIGRQVRFRLDEVDKAIEKNKEW